MTEDDRPVSGLLHFDDVQKYLETKLVRHACPVCDTEGWTVQYTQLQGSEGYLFGTYIVPASEPLTSFKTDAASRFAPALKNGFPVIPLVCNNCGYTRLFDYRTVKLWKEAQGA